MNAPRESSEPDRLRETLRQRGMLAHADLDDESLQGVIDGAKDWIAGRRWSWNVVASNYLKDGRYHAGLVPWQARAVEGGEPE
jgi:hypothetical protein